mgnify:CR=1 FL=1
MFPGVGIWCFPNGFHCFAKVAKSHRGIVKILMVFDDCGGRYSKISRNDIQYDRFYNGILIDFAGVAESSIPNGFHGLWWAQKYIKINSTIDPKSIKNGVKNTTRFLNAKINPLSKMG